MASIYICIILVFRVVQALFNKRSSLEIKNFPMMIGYNSYQHTISAVLGLILIFFSDKGFSVNLPTFIIAAFSGISLFLAGYCGIYAMKSGTVSLCSMFSTAGLIIPVIAGAVLFDNPINPLQIVGLLLFFVAAYLLIGSSKTVYSNFNVKTLLLLLGAMLSNGCTMLAQQMFTEYVPDTDVSVFSFLSFGIIAILTGIFYVVFPEKDKTENTSVKLSKPLLVCGAALAVSVFVINQLATLSTALVSPVILFAFINGGGTIISTVVAAVVYKEKISLKTGLGIIIGIASLIVIKSFE